MSNFLSAAKWTDKQAPQPHQIAAWNTAWQWLTPAQQSEFLELFRAAPAVKPALDPPWLEPALKLIREFEGLSLDAYICPAGIPTIGYGTTITDGRSVRLGDKITKAKAEQLLRDQVQQNYAKQLFQLVPPLAKFSANQQAALISWAYNVGLGAVEQSTLRKRLLAGEVPGKVAAEELPKWNKGDSKVLPGLVRRRAAELSLFLGAQQAQQQRLKVPYYSQRDSTVSGQAQRMCFSSSCAMLTAYLRPGSLTGVNADDQYLKRVLQYGDTTDAAAQVKALASFGITARFTQNADWADLQRQIQRGVPVPCGFLHHGTSSAPSGGGHWLTVIGCTPTDAIVNDPWGEIVVSEGRYTSTNGAGLSYSRKHWEPRWCVEGPGSGWAIIAEPSR